MNELLEEYFKVLERMFNADEWRKNNNIPSWDLIRGKKAYNEYFKLLKEVEQMQKDLHLHYNIVGY